MLSTFSEDFISTQTVILAAVIMTFMLMPIFGFYQLFIKGTVPEGIPWGGVGTTGFMAQLHSTVLATWRLPEILLQEYDKVRTKGLIRRGDLIP
jgi:hypothetical protein